MVFARLVTAFVVTLLVLTSVQSVAAQSADDFDIPGGRFYTQARGSNPAGQGYAVTDADGITFYSAFRASGGVNNVGYPVSHRFIWKGFTTQAFQKVVFQWRPDQGNSVAFVNVFDELTAAGKDSWLTVQREVPPPRPWTEDTGKPWTDVLANHNKLLDQDPAIKDLYLSATDPVALNGLPMSYEDRPNVAVLRAQRKVFQRWKTEQPWAKAGQVVVANGGDVGKEAGLYPAPAVTPKGPNEIPATIKETAPTATPAPAQAATNTPVPGTATSTSTPGIAATPKGGTGSPPAPTATGTALASQPLVGLPPGAATPNPLAGSCGKLENELDRSLLGNATFDGGYRNGVPEGWTWFGKGSVRSIEEQGYEKFGRASWRIDGEGEFVGGGYQVVSGLTPGKIYQSFYATAQQVWGNGKKDGAWPTLREIGLDPTGGTNPDASTVIWGRSSGGQADRDRNNGRGAYGGWKTMGQANPDSWGYNPLVSMIATGSKMTVFIRVKGWPDVSGSNTWIESAQFFEACDSGFKY